MQRLGGMGRLHMNTYAIRLGILVMFGLLQAAAHAITDSEVIQAIRDFEGESDAGCGVSSPRSAQMHYGLTALLHDGKLGGDASYTTPTQSGVPVPPTCNQAR